MKRVAYLVLSFIFTIAFCGESVFATEILKEDKIQIACLVDSETGKEYPIYESVKEMQKNQTKEGENYVIEKMIDIYIPENENGKAKIKEHNSAGISLMASQTNDDYDDSLSWQAKITCQYTKKNSGGSSQLLLTKVSGQYIRHDSSVRIFDRTVTYACKSYGSSAKQRNVKKPTGNSFSYNTGYKIYVPDSNASCVGANCGAYLQRGTSGKKWYFDTAANISLATAP